MKQLITTALFFLSISAKAQTTEIPININVGTIDISGKLDISDTANFVNKTNSQTIAGDKNFSTDLVVNKKTIGTGGSNVFSNLAIGDSALKSNTTGYQITALGRLALLSNTTGNRNLAIGDSALYGNTTGVRNISIGVGSLRTNTTANNSVAIGVDALKNSNGSSNTSVGYFGMNANTTGFSNSAFGGTVLTKNTTGSSNNGFGASALNANTTGESNSAFGNASLFSNLTGSFNTAIGNLSGRYLADGATANTNPSYSTYIGYLARSLTDNATNENVIGYNAISNGSNTTTIGNSSTTGTYIFGQIYNGALAPYLVTDGAANYIQMSKSAGLLGNSVIQQSSTSIGIGKSPSLTLDVNGDIGVPSTGAFRLNGVKAVSSLPGQYNWFFGPAGNLTMTGNNYVTAAGYGALTSVTTGNYLTAVGMNAGNVNSSGSGNTYIGTIAGQSNTTAYGSTFIGSQAGRDNTTGQNNTAVGEATLLLNKVGILNTAVGVHALWANTSNSNTGIGVNAGKYSRTGLFNVFIGSQAGVGNGLTPYRISAKDSAIVLIGTESSRDDLIDSATAINNAIAIGNQARFSKSNQATFGNTWITETRLRGQVLINTETPVTTSQLTIESTTKGALLPRMTKTQRDAISSPAQGLLVFVTDGTGYLSWYNSGWQKVSSVAD